MICIGNFNNNSYISVISVAKPINVVVFAFTYGSRSPGLFKGTVSRDNPYSNFFIDHILLVLLEVLYEDFKFQGIFAVLFNQKGNSSVQATPVSVDSSV
jgi:hypothetical protein